MSESISELAQRLAAQAEAVCRHYLPNGRLEGRYWMVGDIHNSPGRSLFIRLRGPERGRGAAGKWTDAATGEHGDLLDIIRVSCGLYDFREAAEEAKRFLNLPNCEPATDCRKVSPPAPTGSAESARRLFAMSDPIEGTIADTYLQRRGITALHGSGSLRFHPSCYYRRSPQAPTETWPAMIAAVTDLNGTITGAHRTWLDPSGHRKAPVGTPRRAMGNLLGHAVRFDEAHDVLAAGEGIETMLSLRCVLPTMPMMAALSAAHLTAILFQPTLRRLYVARDDDPAGDAAAAKLVDRAHRSGIEAIALSARQGDFNEDLRTFGVDALRVAVSVQLLPADAARFMDIGMSARAGDDLCGDTDASSYVIPG